MTLSPAFTGRGERSRPLRGPSFWMLVFILVFSPLPFASVRPVWWSLYGVLVAAALIAFVVQRWLARRALPAIPWPIGIAGGLVALVSAWGHLQAIPGLLPAVQHPVWSETAAILDDSSLSGYLSLAPERSALIATNYLTYIGFGLLVIWHCRRQRNLDLLLRIFIGAQAAYALYGLTIYLSGLETILWFDKTAYHGVLTSTFVNRNSYATYAGFGALAAMVLVLRFLRHTLGEERSQRTRIREFVETLTSKGWLPPIILLLCMLAVLLTGSRMGLTAVLVAGTLFVIGWTSRLPRGQTRTLGVSLVSLLVCLLAVNFVLSGGLTAERFARLFDGGDGRFDVYPLMLEAVAERPLTGYGLGSFENAFRLYRDETISAFFTRGHNDYLELVMDVGCPAALVVFSAFLILLVSAWRLSRRRGEFEPALLSVAVTVQVGIHSMVDFSLQIPAVMFAYLFLALAGFGQWSGGGWASRQRDECQRTL